MNVMYCVSLTAVNQTNAAKKSAASFFNTLLSKFNIQIKLEQNFNWQSQQLFKNCNLFGTK